jgi:hypothetical protein
VGRTLLSDEDKLYIKMALDYGTECGLPMKKPQLRNLVLDVATTRNAIDPATKKPFVGSKHFIDMLVEELDVSNVKVLKPNVLCYCMHYFDLLHTMLLCAVQ